MCETSQKPIRHHAHKVHHTKKMTLTKNIPKRQTIETDNSLDVNPKVWNLAIRAYNKALHKGYVGQNFNRNRLFAAFLSQKNVGS